MSEILKNTFDCRTDLIGGRRQHRRFAPGGKHPPAATDCGYVSRTILFSLQWFLTGKFAKKRFLFNVF